MHRFNRLLKDFLNGNLDAREFEHQYLTLWREARDSGELDSSPKQAEVLDELFCAVDAFTSDAEILTDIELGEFAIGESELKDRARRAFELLNKTV